MGLRGRRAIPALAMGRADGERVRMGRAEKGCTDVSAMSVPDSPEHMRLAWVGECAALLLCRVRLHQWHKGLWQVVAARPWCLHRNLPYLKITVAAPLRL